MDLIRLSKLLSERGICSRREADRYIEKGLVLVDGHVISELGTKVPLDAKIELKQEARKEQKNKVTLILNKPIGYVSTQPEKGYKAAIELIPKKYQANLSTAGRLDIDSKGLLVFTQDGTVVKKLIGPDSNMEKEYLVRVEGVINPSIIKRLTYGLKLDGAALKRAKVKQLESNVLQIILHEGKKRQIRRMCELVGLQVVGLKRVRVGQVRLGNLPEGKWRFLHPGEKF